MAVEYFDENVELYNLTSKKPNEKSYRYALAYQEITPFTESLDLLNTIIPPGSMFTVTPVSAKIEIPFRFSEEHKRYTMVDGQYSTMMGLGRATMLALALLDALRRKKAFEEAHEKFPDGCMAIGKTFEGSMREGLVKGRIDWSAELVYFLVANPEAETGWDYNATSVLDLQPIPKEGE